MKNALASLLVFSAIGSLPNGTLSFTARPPTRAAAAASARNPTQLHGLLPDFLTRKKSSDAEGAGDSDGAAPPSSDGGAISPEMTELALEKAAGSEDSSGLEECGEEELTETQKLLQRVKQAGTAGAISYALWELGFWGISIPVCVVGYQQLTGHWPDFSNKEDVEKVGAEAFAFVNFARLAVPLRIGLALSTTPWIEENVVQKFMKKEANEECEIKD